LAFLLHLLIELLILLTYLEILKEVQYFYENLHKNKDEDKGCSLKDIVEGLKGASIRKLAEEEKDNLEGELFYFLSPQTLSYILYSTMRLAANFLENVLICLPLVNM
jgi:hypothetical protein